MNDYQSLIEKFYSSFKNKDAEGMVACYHADVHFSDPAFPDLRGWRAGAMWRMLVDRGGADLVVDYSDVKGDESGGSARWEAQYTFGKTGRPVHNKIAARFEFKDGKIIRHIDEFDFWRWSRMALGARGLLLGWSGAVKSAVQQESDKALTMYAKRKRLEPKS